MDLSEPRHVEQRYYAPRPHTADAVSLFEVGVLDKTDFLQSSSPLNLCNLTWKTELTSIRWH